MATILVKTLGKPFSRDDHWSVKVRLVSAVWDTADGGRSYASLGEQPAWRDIARGFAAAICADEPEPRLVTETIPESGADRSVIEMDLEGRWSDSTFAQRACNSRPPPGQGPWRVFTWMADECFNYRGAAA